MGDDRGDDRRLRTATTDWEADLVQDVRNAERRRQLTAVIFVTITATGISLTFASTSFGVQRDNRSALGDLEGTEEVIRARDATIFDLERQLEGFEPITPDLDDRTPVRGPAAGVGRRC